MYGVGYSVLVSHEAMKQSHRSSESCFKDGKHEKRHIRVIVALGRPEGDSCRWHMVNGSLKMISQLVQHLSYCSHVPDEQAKRGSA